MVNDSLRRYFFVQNRVIFLGLGPEGPGVEKTYIQNYYVLSKNILKRVLLHTKWYRCFTK